MRLTFIATTFLAFAAADGMRGAAADPVAEIVTFRLVDGADPSEFTLAAEGMTPFLESTGAVLSRTLSQGEDGLWTDHITWTSLEAATAASEAMMTRPEAEPFMAMIAPGSVTMRHAPILLSMTRE